MAVDSEAIRHNVSARRSNRPQKTGHKTMGRQHKVLRWHENNLVAYLGSREKENGSGRLGKGQLRTFQTGCDQQWGTVVHISWIRLKQPQDFLCRVACIVF